MHRKDLNIKNNVYSVLLNTKSYINNWTNLPYTSGFIIQYQFLSMFTFKNSKRCTICYVKRFSKLSYMYFFIFFAFFTPGKQPYFEISDDHPPNTPTSLVSARGHWRTLDFANAFVSPGVNSRGNLVPSYGASRRRLGDYRSNKKSPCLLYQILP
jgi:hypothetical protein